MIKINKCHFTYKNNLQPTLNLKSLHVREGEHLFLHGSSGSGKSTFLNLLCGILESQGGDIEILKQNFSTLTTRQKDHFRANHFGIIFQQFNLIPYLSVKENILLSLHFSVEKALHVNNKEDEVLRLLDALELSNTLLNTPAMQLSVGQQQRVAVARALIGKPEIILADEPTSALDLRTKESFMKLLFNQIDEQKSTLIFVLHDESLQKNFSHTLDFSKLNKASQ